MREQYQVEMEHAFEFEKIWEIVRLDPKWNKVLTSMEAQSNRSRNSCELDVPDKWTNIDLNTDTDDIHNDIEEISLPPRQSIERDKAKRTQRHAGEADRKAQ